MTRNKTIAIVFGLVSAALVVDALAHSYGLDENAVIALALLIGAFVSCFSASVSLAREEKTGGVVACIVGGLIVLGIGVPVFFSNFNFRSEAEIKQDVAQAVDDAREAGDADWPSHYATQAELDAVAKKTEAKDRAENGFGGQLRRVWDYDHTRPSVIEIVLLLVVVPLGTFGVSRVGKGSGGGRRPAWQDVADDL